MFPWPDREKKTKTNIHGQGKTESQIATDRFWCLIVLCPYWWQVRAQVCIAKPA